MRFVSLVSLVAVVSLGEPRAEQGERIGGPLPFPNWSLDSARG